MWTTWFLTSSYDVRFLTDSIFERCCRAVHLGVLVGFVVISPNFNLSRQDSSVLQTFCKERNSSSCTSHGLTHTQLSSS